tara:strand:+ start:1562 stop:3094 length:1533 start_codon:yes stop_codon:yes gene_type:complete
MKIFKEDMDKLKVNSNKCPSKETRFHMVKGTDDTFNFNEYHKEDAANELATIPDCNEAFYNGDQKGCCKKPNPNNEENVCNNSDNSTGLKFLYNDGTNDTTYSICHKDPVKQVFNSILNDPDKIRKFFTLIAVSILSLLVTAIIGTCYEFWLQYGNSIECLKFKSKCSNIGKSNEISLVDYMFPNSLCYYPYQKCEFSQSGGKNMQGGEFISTYKKHKEMGAKCITLDPPNYSDGGKPFPYNVADWGKNVDSEYFSTILKAFSFFFLFPILLVRIVFNGIFSYLSRAYQTHVKHNAIAKNFIFLLLTGLIFTIIAGFTGGDATIAFGGPQVYLSFFQTIIYITMFIGLIGTLFVTLFPKKLLSKQYGNCIDPEYYRLFSGKLLYSISKDKDGNELDLSSKVKNIIFNIFLIILIIPIVGVLSYISGMFGWLFSWLWISLSFTFKLFYVPLSNPLEFFDVLKSHGDLLTILFCVGIIGSSALALNPTTTGVMSMLLAFIILYKVFKNFKKN